MSKQVIAGDLQTTGSTTVAGSTTVGGDCTVGGDILFGGSIGNDDFLHMDGESCAISASDTFSIQTSLNSIEAGSFSVNVDSGNFLVMSARASCIVNIDSNNNSTDTSFIIAKNSTAHNPTDANKLLELNETGEFSIKGDSLVLTSSGNLSIAGNLYTYGNFAPFTGAHVYPATEDLSAHVGSALVLVDGERVALASQPNSRNVAGILISCTEKSGDSPRSSLGPIADSFGYVCQVAAVGDSRSGDLLGVSVCNLGGEVVAGDLLVTSSRPGYLMKQEDDIIRSSTVAKAMQPVNFSEDGVATGVYAYVYCG